MDRLIPLFSPHSPNNCPRRRSHPHTYQALLPPLTFPRHLVSFPALQLTVTCLLLSRLGAALPRSRPSCMRFCVVHELRVACFKQPFATLRPFGQEFQSSFIKSTPEKEFLLSKIRPSSFSSKMTPASPNR